MTDQAFCLCLALAKDFSPATDRLYVVITKETSFNEITRQRGFWLTVSQTNQPSRSKERKRRKPLHDHPPSRLQDYEITT